METRPMVAARDRNLPVDEAFVPLLPSGGLQRGHVIGCTGPAAMTLSVALATRSMVAGSWLAVVGVPMLGLEACAELGVPLSRLVHVAADGAPSTWAERVAAAADGFDAVLTRPPAGAERMLRKVRTRLQARGVVMFAVSPASPTVSCDVEFTTTSLDWSGIGMGTGRLTGRRVTVRCAGRRIPQPIECEMWLPGDDGRLRPVAPVEASTVEASTVAELEWAG